MSFLSPLGVGAEIARLAIIGPHLLRDDILGTGQAV